MSRRYSTALNELGRSPGMLIRHEFVIMVMDQLKVIYNITSTNVIIQFFFQAILWWEIRQ
jgi:hypothetical protein